MAVEAIWTQESYLMWHNGTSYVQLIPVKETPDLGGEPEQIQTTDLSQVKNHTYISGLQDPGALQFTANYTVDNFTAVKAAEAAGLQNYAVYFGSGRDETIDDGNGAFYFEGELSCWKNGNSVNDVSEFTISITVSSEIYFNEDPLNP